MYYLLCPEWQTDSRLFCFLRYPVSKNEMTDGREEMYYSTDLELRVGQYMLPKLSRVTNALNVTGQCNIQLYLPEGHESHWSEVHVILPSMNCRNCHLGDDKYQEFNIGPGYE